MSSIDAMQDENDHLYTAKFSGVTRDQPIRGHWRHEEWGGVGSGHQSHMVD